ncbi:MAG: bifunctional nicotinamidase/pyrazinamidase [Nitrospiraceae bacterium]|nr:bifunctional nicotinamidase/pyrazinamidase [Nitrospiraceae bacterium]
MDKNAALLIIDVQNDFCPNGNLAVPEGNRVIPVLNRYIALFREKGLPIFASRDWHPEKTSHFKSFGGIWPVHCVQGSDGAKFHSDLQLPPDVVILSKGVDPQRDDYSAFQGVTDSGARFPDILRERRISKLYVGGLATDYCVKESVLEGLRHGLAVTLLEDASRGVDLETGDSEKAVATMRAAGAMTASLADLENLS